MSDALQDLADVLDGSEPCRQDPEMWFAENDGGDTFAVHDAKALCNGTPRRYGESTDVPCHARTQCYMAGLLFSTHGVWGGTDPVERQAIRRKRRLPYPSMMPGGLDT